MELCYIWLIELYYANGSMLHNAYGHKLNYQLYMTVKSFNEKKIMDQLNQKSTDFLDHQLLVGHVTGFPLPQKSLENWRYITSQGKAGKFEIVLDTRERSRKFIIVFIILIFIVLKMKKRLSTADG